MKPMARKHHAPIPPTEPENGDKSLSLEEMPRIPADAPPEKQKRPRVKWPTILMKELETVHTGSAPLPPSNEYEPDPPAGNLRTISGALRRVDGSPEFTEGTDTGNAAAAIQWAADAHLTGVFHPVIDRGAFVLEAEEIKRIVVKARTP